MVKTQWGQKTNYGAAAQDWSRTDHPGHSSLMQTKVADGVASQKAVQHAQKLQARIIEQITTDPEDILTGRIMPRPEGGDSNCPAENEACKLLAQLQEFAAQKELSAEERKQLQSLETRLPELFKAVRQHHYTRRLNDMRNMRRSVIDAAYATTDLKNIMASDKEPAVDANHRHQLAFQLGKINEQIRIHEERAKKGPSPIKPDDISLVNRACNDALGIIADWKQTIAGPRLDSLYQEAMALAPSKGPKVKAALTWLEGLQAQYDHELKSRRTRLAIADPEFNTREILEQAELARKSVDDPSLLINSPKLDLKREVDPAEPGSEREVDTTRTIEELRQVQAAITEKLKEHKLEHVSAELHPLDKFDLSTPQEIIGRELGRLKLLTKEVKEAAEDLRLAQDAGETVTDDSQLGFAIAEAEHKLQVVSETNLGLARNVKQQIDLAIAELTGHFDVKGLDIKKPDAPGAQSTSVDRQVVSAEFVEELKTTLAEATEACHGFNLANPAPESLEAILKSKLDEISTMNTRAFQDLGQANVFTPVNYPSLAGELKSEVNTAIARAFPLTAGSQFPDNLLEAINESLDEQFNTRLHHEVQTKANEAGLDGNQIASLKATLAARVNRFGHEDRTARGIYVKLNQLLGNEQAPIIEQKQVAPIIEEAGKPAIQAEQKPKTPQTALAVLQDEAHALVEGSPVLTTKPDNKADQTTLQGLYARAAAVYKRIMTASADALGDDLKYDNSGRGAVVNNESALSVAQSDKSLLVTLLDKIAQMQKTRIEPAKQLLAELKPIVVEANTAISKAGSIAMRLDISNPADLQKPASRSLEAEIADRANQLRTLQGNIAQVASGRSSQELPAAFYRTRMTELKDQILKLVEQWNENHGNRKPMYSEAQMNDFHELARLSRILHTAPDNDGHLVKAKRGFETVVQEAREAARAGETKTYEAKLRAARDILVRHQLLRPVSQELPGEIDEAKLLTALYGTSVPLYRMQSAAPTVVDETAAQRILNLRQDFDSEFGPEPLTIRKDQAIPRLEALQTQIRALKTNAQAKMDADITTPEGRAQRISYLAKFIQNLVPRLIARAQTTGNVSTSELVELENNLREIELLREVKSDNLVRTGSPARASTAHTLSPLDLVDGYPRSLLAGARELLIQGFGSDKLQDCKYFVGAEDAFTMFAELQAALVSSKPSKDEDSRLAYDMLKESVDKRKALVPQGLIQMASDMLQRTYRTSDPGSAPKTENAQAAFAAFVSLSNALKTPKPDITAKLAMEQLERAVNAPRLKTQKAQEAAAMEEKLAAHRRRLLEQEADTFSKPIDSGIDLLQAPEPISGSLVSLDGTSSLGVVVDSGSGPIDETQLPPPKSGWLKSLFKRNLK